MDDFRPPPRFYIGPLAPYSNAFALRYGPHTGGTTVDYGAGVQTKSVVPEVPDLGSRTHLLSTDIRIPNKEPPSLLTQSRKDPPRSISSPSPEMLQFKLPRRKGSVPAVLQKSSSFAAPDVTPLVTRAATDVALSVNTLDITLPMAATSPLSTVPDRPNLVLREGVSESRKGTVDQRPASSTPIKRQNSLVPSPKATATINAFNSALHILGKAPLPGIGSATGLLVEFIGRHHELALIEGGLQRLAVRIERLRSVVDQVIDCDERGEELCAPLITELHKLRDALELSERQNRLIQFFNTTDKLRSVNDHIADLDGTFGYLTSIISAKTNKKTTELQEKIEKVSSSIHTSIPDKYEPLKTMVTRMSNNEIPEIQGNFVSGNVAHDNAAMLHEIRDNKIDGIDGNFVSGNFVRGNTAMIYAFNDNKIGHVKGAMLSNNIITNIKSPSVDNTSE